jgi:AcrR family transcriptional regulator
VADVKGRRAYRSPVRAEAALRTRRAIVAAAAAMFAERGYGASSLREVSEVAGVARPTVAAAFGSKPALLRQILDEALAGDDEPVPVAERTWFAPVWRATDPAGVLAAYADVCTVIGRRAGRMFEVVAQAVDQSPEVGELWADLTRNRRAGATMILDRALAVGGLRLERQQAVDAVWLLNDPRHHLELVSRRGWAEPTFRAWLAGQLRAAVL